MTRLEAVVAGRVHGVGFRMFVLDEARRLGLVGWVANEAGDRVRVVAQGAEAPLRQLLATLEAGPPSARVDGVTATWSTAAETFDRFAIRSAWHPGD